MIVSSPSGYYIYFDDLNNFELIPCENIGLYNKKYSAGAILHIHNNTSDFKILISECRFFTETQIKNYINILLKNKNCITIRV